jgi:hypothetical protein
MFISGSIWSLFILTACAHQPSSSLYGDYPSFFSGIEHGILIIPNLIASVFTDVRFYAFPNSGVIYDFGFVVGLLIGLPVGVSFLTLPFRSNQNATGIGIKIFDNLSQEYHARVTNNSANYEAYSGIDKLWNSGADYNAWLEAKNTGKESRNVYDADSIGRASRFLDKLNSSDESVVSAVVAALPRHQALEVLQAALLRLNKRPPPVVNGIVTIYRLFYMNMPPLSYMNLSPRSPVESAYIKLKADR